MIQRKPCTNIVKVDKMWKLFACAAFVIFLIEATGLTRIVRKYQQEGDRGIPSVDEFIARASFEDVLRARVHSVNAFTALCVMTIGSLMK